VPIPEPKSCRDAYIMCRWYGLSRANLLPPFELVQSNFSVGRLMEFLTAVRLDVEITVRPTRKEQGALSVIDLNRGSPVIRVVGPGSVRSPTSRMNLHFPARHCRSSADAN
jgi:hypothetical protein